VAQPHDIFLAVHITVGSAALLLGPVAMWRGQARGRYRQLGLSYLGLILAVGVTAIGLAALNWSQLWWLTALGVLTAVLGWGGFVVAPRHGSAGWLRVLVHAQGGSYIALVTATAVVSTPWPAQIVSWTLPTLVGVGLIEWWYRAASTRPAGRAPAAP
jgi:uncharacterized membrane protein